MTIPVNDEIYLRQLQSSDAADIFAAVDRQRAYLGRWLPFVETTQTIGDSEEFVNSILNTCPEEFELVFTIRSEKAGFMGLMGFHYTDRDNHKTEIGYWISEEFQKRGIITNAFKTLCLYAFKELNIHRIQVRCALGNEASRRIPIKLGFSLEGIERQGECIRGNLYRDLEVFSLLRTDLEMHGSMAEQAFCQA